LFLTAQTLLDIPRAMIDEVDKRVIQLIQGDLPLDLRPFGVLAEQAGISEKEFVERVASLKKKGIIRRFGATLRHQEAGFSSNAMVAWIVPEEQIEEVGKTMARFRAVTHCYQRKTHKVWPYNLYTMIHGDGREKCRGIAKQMSRKAGIRDYILLFSEKEFKKTSMQYFE
jgi:DNA-binding Lrp family transcriptional regulator